MVSQRQSKDSYFAAIWPCQAPRQARKWWAGGLQCMHQPLKSSCTNNPQKSIAETHVMPLCPGRHCLRYTHCFFGDGSISVAGNLRAPAGAMSLSLSMHMLMADVLGTARDHADEHAWQTCAETMTSGRGCVPGPIGLSGAPLPSTQRLSTGVVSLYLPLSLGSYKGATLGC